MTKYDEYGEKARILFVEEQKSITTIALLLSLSEKTLHKWKNQYGWEEQRRKFLEGKTSCHNALYELLNTIVSETLEKYRQDKELPDKDTLNFIKAMADKLPRVKNIEDLFEAQKQGEHKADKADIVETVHRYLTGQN